MLSALSQINIELTSRCDRRNLCVWCGHQEPSVNHVLKYGDMEFALLVEISWQVTPPIVISFHRDGDPLVYPRLGEALRLFQNHPTSIVTHGQALSKRADEIIDNATTVTVSVIPKDPDREIQLKSLRQFIEKKGDSRPMLQLKFVGNVEDPAPYEALGVPIIDRPLHNKGGSFHYVKREPPTPEIRVCQDFLSKPTVNWRGDFFQCNRLDGNNDGLLGSLYANTLDELWNGPKRREWLKAHMAGRRDLANPLCASCDYWGLPA